MVLYSVWYHFRNREYFAAFLKGMEGALGNPFCKQAEALGNRHGHEAFGRKQTQALGRKHGEVLGISHGHQALGNRHGYRQRQRHYEIGMNMNSQALGNRHGHEVFGREKAHAL